MATNAVSSISKYFTLERRCYQRSLPTLSPIRIPPIGTPCNGIGGRFGRREAR